jgi:hypothetical protein
MKPTPAEMQVTTILRDGDCAKLRSVLAGGTAVPAPEFVQGGHGPSLAWVMLYLNRTLGAREGSARPRPNRERQLPLVLLRPKAIKPLQYPRALDEGRILKKLIGFFGSVMIPRASVRAPKLRLKARVCNEIS